MPQMAPYNWLMLFSLFNIIMIFITSSNYYMTMKFSRPHSNKSSQLIYYHWTL